MMLGTLSTSLLGNLLPGKRVRRTREGQVIKVVTELSQVAKVQLEQDRIFNAVSFVSS